MKAYITQIFKVMFTYNTYVNACYLTFYQVRKESNTEYRIELAPNNVD